MDKGWVKLHRQIADNHFLMNDEKAFAVFMKLLIHVNRKGEIAAGRRQLGELFNINDRTLYDVLIRLEKQQIINITSNHKYSIINISNWSKYQQTPTATPTVTQPQPNRKPTTAQHYNKNKNRELEIEEAFKKKELAAKNRKPGVGYQKAKEIAEIIKQKKLKGAN